MIAQLVTPRAGRGRRILGYVGDAFPPLVHAPFAALWYAAAHGGSGPRLLPGVAHAVLALLALRVVDDWKDEAYDRAHHPDRPLPSGRVRPRDLALLMALLVAALALLNAVAFGPTGLTLVGAQLAFAGVMAAWRRRGTFLQRHWVLEVLLVQPLNLLLTLHALRGGLGGGAAVVAACTGAILQLEVLRKTALVPRPGEELYSNLAGPGPALAAAVVLAGVSAGWVAWVSSAIGAWIVLAAWVVHALALATRAGRERRGVVGIAFLAVTLLALALRPAA